MQFIPTAEGRLLPPALADNDGAWAYEYHYKDHLGNLRVSFRPGRSYTYVATMERSQAATEELLFSNLSDAIRVPNGCTGGGVKLTSANPMGPMRILKVRRGDVVSAKVKGWYSTPASSNTGGALNLWLQAIPGRNVPGQSESSQTFPSLQVGLTLNTPTGVPTNAPKAYLQLQAYDEQSQPAGQQTRFVSEQNSCLTDLLIDGYKVEQDGYLRVYVASESDAPAFFDQLEITHQEALITQEQHFSPWGLVLKGIEKQGQPEHKFQFNGIEKESALALNWNLTDFRAQDPQLGRLWQIDPIDKEDQSPYSWVINNPMLYADPLGLDTLKKGSNGIPIAPTLPACCVLAFWPVRNKQALDSLCHGGLMLQRALRSTTWVKHWEDIITGITCLIKKQRLFFKRAKAKSLFPTAYNKEPPHHFRKGHLFWKRHYLAASESRTSG